MKDESNRHRSLYFIAQNIVIVINENEIVNNMHEAYENLVLKKLVLVYLSLDLQKLLILNNRLLLEHTVQNQDM